MPSQQVQVGHHQVQAEAAPCLTESCRASVAPALCELSHLGSHHICCEYLIC